MTPTTDTTARATRKASLMWGAYEVTPAGSLPHLFFVEHKSDPARCYLNDTRRGTCQCPAFEKGGDCKHRHFLNEWRDVEEGEAAAQDPATVA
jgi:hypothetical protein